MNNKTTAIKLLNELNKNATYFMVSLVMDEGKHKGDHIIITENMETKDRLIRYDLMNLSRVLSKWDKLIDIYSNEQRICIYFR